MNPALFTIIYGPTASGKTALALTLARQTQANILSYDARQVYQGMDIGTGKDIPAGYQSQLSAINQRPVYTSLHQSDPQLFGFDIVRPDEPFSIRHFYEYAQPIMAYHRQIQKPLIIVGGSWPYAQVLIHPPASLMSSPNLKQRQQLTQLSLSDLQTQAQTIAPQRWADLNNSDRQNPRRLIRLIESGSLSTATVPPLLAEPEYQLTILQPTLTELEPKLHQRIQQRWDQGMVAETTKLLEQCPDWTAPAFSATGYQLTRQFIAGTLSQSDLFALWFRAERQYAKRQLTWVKKLILK
jgi:tRNA dimethylallyltransferase